MEPRAREVAQHGLVSRTATGRGPAAEREGVLGAAACRVEARGSRRVLREAPCSPPVHGWPPQATAAELWKPAGPPGLGMHTEEKGPAWPRGSSQHPGLQPGLGQGPPSAASSQGVAWEAWPRCGGAPASDHIADLKGQYPPPQEVP